MYLRRIKIGTRLSAGMTLILLFMIALIVLGLSNMRLIGEKMDRAAHVTSTRTWYADTIKDGVCTESEAVLRGIVSNDEAVRAFERVRILTARATYEEGLEQLDGLEGTQKGKALLAQLKEALAGVRQLDDETLQLSAAGKTRQAGFVYMNSVRPAVLGLQQVATELVVYERDQAGLYYNEALAMYGMTRSLFLLMGALIVAVAVAAAVVLTRSITRPLKEGVEVANRLAENDLDVEIKAEGADEPAELLSAMGNMVQKLRQIKVLEQQLLQSQKLETVGRLAGGIAHDFNNMLGVILGNAELLRMQIDSANGAAHATGGVSGRAKMHARCRTIEKAVMRAKDFVRQLLTFSKQQVLELATADLNRVVEDFEKMMRRMLGENIEVRLVLQAALPTARLDVGQINQVLLNLVVNAREAMPQGGMVTIETGLTHVPAADGSPPPPDVKPGAYLLLSVTDTGAGIDPAIKDKIFDPFFTTKEQGTGLGLSVVYGIVKKHGGFITVGMEKERGTAFCVYLPVSGEAQAMEEETAQPPVTGKEGILLIEDDHDLRELVYDMLTALGHKVHAAHDGEQALALFRQDMDAFDLVVSDMVMPGKGGPEVFEEMSRLKPGIPCLFVSGYGVVPGEAGPVNGGRVGFVQKPFSADALSRKIREMLDGRGHAAAGPEEEGPKAATA